MWHFYQEVDQLTSSKSRGLPYLRWTQIRTD